MLKIKFDFLLKGSIGRNIGSFLFCKTVQELHRKHFVLQFFASFKKN